MTLPKNTLESLRIERPAEEESPSRLRFWLVLICLLVLGGAAAVLWTVKARTVEVRTAVARQTEGTASSSSTVLNASGYVTARRRATVSSKATAKVIEVLLEEGMKVQAGQVLARLDTSNVEANLHLAEAQVAAARRTLEETQANLERAESDLKRIRSLAEQKISSASELDQAQADAKSLRARLALQQEQQAVAERQVDIWKQEMEDRVIRAPFSGVIVSKDAQPGEMISPISAGGGFIRTGIGTLVDMTSLEIEVDVNESYINRVSAGQRVTAKLDAYADWEIPTKVIAVIPTADRQKATVKVRIGFERMDPRILPDMGVKVAFRSDDSPAPAGNSVRAPAGAVRTLEGSDVLWVVRDGRLERRAVKCLRETGSADVVILAGLAGGEKVVVEGPPNLTEGTRVKEKNP